MQLQDITITKVTFYRMFLLYIHSTCSFSNVLPGWKGSAADGHVFDNAHRESLAISSNIYLLANAKFPTCDALMILYKRDQYHLKE